MFHWPSVSVLGLDHYNREWDKSHSHWLFFLFFFFFSVILSVLFIHEICCISNFTGGLWEWKACNLFHWILQSTKQWGLSNCACSEQILFSDFSKVKQCRKYNSCKPTKHCIKYGLLPVLPAVASKLCGEFKTLNLLQWFLFSLNYCST